MNRLLLKFRSGFSQAQLEETEFHSSLVGQPLRCCRGQYQPKSSHSGTFTWTGGVAGLSVLLLKAKISLLLGVESSQDSSGICSDLTETASALDSSLAKKPKWVLDMFGLDSSDTPICHRMFLRRNPERKRPGPVWVFLNTSFLDPACISVWLDGRELSDVEEHRELLRMIGYNEGQESAPVVEALTQGPPRKGSHVLISFLDHYILAVSGYGSSPKRDHLIEAECRQALRLALLAFDCVYVPAVSYVQSPLCRRLLDEHRSQVQLGAIRLLSDAPAWREFVDVRRGEYAAGSKEWELYSSPEVLSSLEDFAIRATERDTTRALHQEWDKAIYGATFREQLIGASDGMESDSDRDVAILKCAAQELGSQAFIARHLQELLARQKFSIGESRLTRSICDLFFSHFRSHLDLDAFDSLAYVQDARTYGGRRAYSYGEMARTLRSEQPEIFQEMTRCNADDLWQLRRSVGSLGVG